MFKKEERLISHYDSHPDYQTALVPRDTSVILGRFRDGGLDIPKEGWVLDLGCGDGRFSAYLSGKGYDVVAVDYSMERLVRAPLLHPGPEYILADLHKYIECAADIRRGFDIIFLLDVLEHVEHPRSVVDRCREIGRFVVASCPKDQVYVAHLQVFRDIEDFIAKCGPPTRAMYYKSQIVTVYRGILT